MWGEFALISLVMSSILLVPGYLVMRTLGARGIWPLLLAPILSLSLIAIVGQALALVHVPSTPVLLLGILIMLPALALLVTRRKGLHLAFPHIEPWIAPIYLILGIALGYNLFLSRLGTPDALFQAYDVTQHLNLIQAMSGSGTFTSLNVGPYLSLADQAIDPLGNSGFYPAAWHAACALVVQMTGCSVPLVINVSMFVLSCLAFPLSVLALLGVLFPQSRAAHLCGALVSLAFVAFPWNLLAFGPVYANIAGFALMPCAMALFIHLLADDLSPFMRARIFGALVITAIGLALCHPNTIFTCVAFLAPYCVSRICAACARRGWGVLQKASLCILFLAFCAGFWIFCYRLPAFRETVAHVWPPFAWAFQEIINILTLCYNMGFNYETAAQLLLGALVVVGAIRALHVPGRRWLVASYAAICYILLISATHRDELKQLLAGFWYTDPMRLAAIAAIAAIPLATLGALWAYGTIMRLAAANSKGTRTKPHGAIVAGAAAALFLGINFMPEFNLPGLHHEYSAKEQAEYKNVETRDWPKSVHTTFGDFREAIEATYSYTQPLDESERLFLNKLDMKSAVPEGALVINNPMDGSFLTYGTDGLRVYYRNFVGYGGENETKESRIIRERLCDYASDSEVQAAVEAVDAEYVLVLRGGERQCGFINLRGDYNEALFSGISSITPETPGFTCVCETGILRLYRIDR
ncbi:hypothetical protein E0L17_07015 [Olsenella sp. SW781]|uniref:DUF6541 family protein n=1 Tax=Olsenella sp. SW781 TaxID=2530046 RepID=UPI0014387B28|nr:DUF6541 family protein [Olsenella sp. SW781]NJE81080.1 hypothetical protein [Olsenella sp. SW781]